MTDSPDRGRDRQWSRGGDDQTGFGNPGYGNPGYGNPGYGDPGYPGYPDPGYSDPAYASQAPYGSPYQTPPTERLPPQSPYGYDPYTTGQYPGQPPAPDAGSPPGGPKSPRWLWIVAGVAVVTVIGLVIALVIVNSSQQQTVVAPLPPQAEPSYTVTPSPTTTPRTPTTRPFTPAPTRPSVPSTGPSTGPSSPSTRPTVPGATDSVVYTVEGTGRAINLTYVDSGGLLQTEFNVELPWSKEVSLPQPGDTSASISIINVGREVTCSISVNGVQLELRTGVGLTICAPTG